MAYRIRGLDPALFTSLRQLDDAALRARNARRVIADAKPGFPCRVSLEDAEPGEPMLLVNHVSHDVDNPFRASHAIYVRERADVAADHAGSIPPMMRMRVLSLRGFNAEGLLTAACLTQPDEAERGILDLFEDTRIAYIHAHNALPGCFAARIDRS